LATQRRRQQVRPRRRAFARAPLCSTSQLDQPAPHALFVPAEVQPFASFPELRGGSLPEADGWQPLAES
jgi:hypothetical protein